MDIGKPSPDVLLTSLREEEARAGRGRLKVFLGMCPGVGKTYAMLEQARRDKLAGVSVLVGVVETHGRAETEALLEGLDILPLQRIAYKGVNLSEMDLQGILDRRPEWVVVDELAHSNAPGCRHSKRWQDVLELLDAGIHVLTALNIQHIESRADTVRQIAGAPVRETVPDSLLDLADEIELVDITPQALRERLKDGKVYRGDGIAAASDNFFQESILNALREMALRFTAERVDRRLRTLRQSAVKSAVWRSGERLLVAVGPSPFSTQLVRWTCRLAASQGARWVAAHIETSAALGPQARGRLDANLALARQLGAEMVSTRGDDIPAALVRLALEHNATQIIVGKPRGNPVLDMLKGGNIVERLLRIGGNIDIYVVPSESSQKPSLRTQVKSLPLGNSHEYGTVLLSLALMTGVLILLPARYYLAAGLIYLLGVVLLSLRVGRWPVLLAGVASAFIWNYLFILPKFTFHISAPEDYVLFLAYFVVAVVTGQLTARIRLQASDEHNREARATALFKLTHTMATARSMDEAIFAALKQMDELFSARSALVFYEGEAKESRVHPSSTFLPDARELGVALWVCKNRRPAGRFTDTLSSVVGYWLPMVRDERCFGAVCVAVERTETLTFEQKDLLEAFARQLALVIDREYLRAAGERERVLAESERLHRTLLDCVSHELRTPLAVITGNLDHFDAAQDTRVQEALIEESRAAVRRLNRLVSNLLNQTRLESGTLKPRMDWCDPSDILNGALAHVGDLFKERPLHIELPDDLPPVRLDHALTEQSLVNLLMNAALHTPPGAPVSVGARVADGGGRLQFFVADQGPGISATDKTRIFEKFARGARAHAGGLGLGLSIAHGFMLAQGGEAFVADRPGGGTVFTLSFNLEKADTGE